MKDLSEEAILERASKYTRLEDWYYGDQKSYRMAGKLGIREKCSAHMAKKRRATYTKEEVMSIARNYTNKTAFATNARGAYLAARRFDILKTMDFLKPLPLPKRGAGGRYIKENK